MAAENSFDIVCKVDMQEVTNALDQARREIETRYDLKGSKNEVKLEKTDITLTVADEMKLKAVIDILQSKLHKRGIPLEKAKEIVRLIKDSKVRVQASIQEDQVRVSGKNRDDLQKIIALVKEKDLGIALQFTNYRST